MKTKIKLMVVVPAMAGMFLVGCGNNNSTSEYNSTNSTSMTSNAETNNWNTNNPGIMTNNPAMTNVDTNLMTNMDTNVPTMTNK